MSVFYPNLHSDNIYGKGDDWIGSVDTIIEETIEKSFKKTIEKPIEKHNESLVRSRLNEFMSYRDKLIDLHKHYMKIKKQWTSCDSIIKIIGITIGGISGIVTVIITPIVGIPLVGIVTGSFAACDLFLTEVLSISLSARKKKIYREICECLNMSIAKLWSYQNKALSDQLITDVEMDGARNIVSECISEIAEIKRNVKKK